MGSNIFLDHPSAVGETYGEHMRVALSFSGDLFVAGLACLIHAFAPFLFTRTASRAIIRLHERLCVSRRRHATRSGSEHADAEDLPAGLTL